MTAARMYNHQPHSHPSSGLRYVNSAPSRNDHASLAAAAPPIPPASMFFPSNFPSAPPPFLGGGGGPSAAVGGGTAAGGLPLPHPTRHPPYHNDPAAPLMPRGSHTTTATSPPVLQQPNASLHPLSQHPPHAGGNHHHHHPVTMMSHPPPPPPPSDRMRILMGGGGSAAAMLPPPPGMGGGLPFPPYPVLSSPPFLHHLHTMMPLHPSLVLTDSSRRRTNDSGGPRSHRTPRNSPPPPPVLGAPPHQYHHTNTRSSTTLNKSSQSTGGSAADATTTGNSGSGGAGGSTVETNPKRLRQRVKQLCFGRVTEGYKQYRRLVPRRLREKENELHPSTPVETTICSKRQWDAVVANWRRALHKWDTVHDASVMSLGGPHVVYQNGSTEPSDPALLLEEDVELELKRYQELLEWVHAEGDGDDGEGGDSPPPPAAATTSTATTTSAVSALSLDPEAVMAAMSSPPARGTTTEEGTTSPSAAPLVVATPLASIHIPRPWDLKHNRTPAVRGTSNPSQESTPVMHRTPCRPSAKAAARHSTIASHQDPLLIADPSAAPEQVGPSNNSLGSVRSASVSMSPTGEYFDSVKIEVVELSEEPNDEAKYAVTGREVLYLDQSSATSVFENLKRKQFAVDRTFVCMLQRTPQASDPEGSHKLKVQLAQRKPIALQRGGADLPQFVVLDQLQLLLSSVETVQKWLDDSERPRLFFRGALPIRQRPIDDVHMLSDSVHRQEGTGGNASQPSEAASSHNITFSPSGLYALSPTSLTHHVNSSLSASSHRNPMMMTPMAQLRVTPSFFATTGVHQSSNSGVGSAWPRSPVPSAESPVVLDGVRRHDDDPQQRQREGHGGSSPLFLPTPVTPSQQP